MARYTKTIHCSMQTSSYKTHTDIKHKKLTDMQHKTKLKHTTSGTQQKHYNRENIINKKKNKTHKTFSS